MPTTGAAYTENQSVTMSDGSPADNVQSTGTIDAAASEIIAFWVQITFTFHASATDYVDCKFGNSVDSGTTDDTIWMYERRVDADAGNTVTFSEYFELVPFLNIEVDNQSNQELTGLVVEYAYVKATTA